MKGSFLFLRGSGLGGAMLASALSGGVGVVFTNSVGQDRTGANGENGGKGSDSSVTSWSNKDYQFDEHHAGAANAAIPFSELAARATADYKGDALGITATPEGARLRCGFQKLEGRATPQGLWLESADTNGGRFRLVAVAVARGSSGAPQCAPPEAASSVRSGTPIVTVPQRDQAPLGAPCTHWA